MTILYFFHLYYSVEQSDLVVYPLKESSWSSQIFILPVKTPNNYLWFSCNRRSRFYCVFSFETDFMQQNNAIELRLGTNLGTFHNDRTSHKMLRFLNAQARKTSDEIFESNFWTHNFLGVRESCCPRQYASYYANGFLRSNQTPREFFLKLTDYSVENKTLNLIKSFYLPFCKFHVITKLGFGIGKLKRSQRQSVLRTAIPEAPYRLFIGKNSTPEIPFDNPGDFLTYSWFKKNVICQDQPWICGRERPVRNWKSVFIWNRQNNSFTFDKAN